jgi:transposase
MKDIIETVTISKTEYDKLCSSVTELTAKVEWLMEQFRLAWHCRFGSSYEKSSDYEQLNLFNESEIVSDILVPEPELVEIEKHFHKRKNMVNQNNLPDNLPVEVVEHDLPADERTCSVCEGDLHVIGRETLRRELKLIPAKAVIVEHVRKVYGCRHCERNECGVPIVKSAVSNPVIKGGFASPEAIAHIAAQKFVMAVPLYRQEQE